MQEAAGATVVVGRMQLGRLAPLQVAPGENRRERPVAFVDGDQRVPEARDRKCVTLADLREHRPASVDEVIGIEVGVCEVRVAGLCRSGLVVRDRADRR